MREWVVGFLAAALCAGWSDAPAAEPFTANTLKLSKDEVPPAATIDAMAWLAGTWRGSGLGGENEEIWSTPRHGGMMGMYRMLQDGRPVFYEFLTLAERDGSLALRLKHFHPDMRGWEERNEFLTFPLVAMENGRIYFEGITFEPRGDDVTVWLAIEDREAGSAREEVFRYRRQGAATR